MQPDVVGERLSRDPLFVFQAKCALRCIKKFPEDITQDDIDVIKHAFQFAYENGKL